MFYSTDAHSESASLMVTSVVRNMHSQFNKRVRTFVKIIKRMDFYRKIGYLVSVNSCVYRAGLLACLCAY